MIALAGWAENAGIERTIEPIAPRDDSGNARLVFEPVDLVEVVKAVSPKARWLSEERGHTDHPDGPKLPRRRLGRLRRT